MIKLKWEIGLLKDLNSANGFLLPGEQSLKGWYIRADLTLQMLLKLKLQNRLSFSMTLN